MNNAAANLWPAATLALVGSPVYRTVNRGGNGTYRDRRGLSFPVITRTASASAQQAARKAGADPFNPIGLEIRHAIQRDWSESMIAQIKAAGLRGPSQRAAFESVKDNDPSLKGAPTPQIAKLKLRNARWSAYLRALIAVLRAAKIAPIAPEKAVKADIQDAAEMGGLGQIGQALTRIVCSDPRSASAASRGVFDQEPGNSAGGGGGGGGGGGAGFNLPTSATTAATSSGSVHDMGALQPLTFIPAEGIVSTAASRSNPPSSMNVTTSLPPATGGGGEEAGYLSQDEEADLGSWLSKALGKIGDKTNLPIKQLAAPVAAGASNFIPVIGPLISGAIGAVATVANAREQTKQAEAAARAAAASNLNLPGGITIPDFFPTPTQPAPPPAAPARRAPAKNKLPTWALPALAVGAGALVLTRGRR